MYFRLNENSPLTIVTVFQFLNFLNTYSIKIYA